ncbi:helicase-exonuclease AddAB subunit AddA [Lapidilactobacillus achengensis]|uniref:ATP-dependent helicase/nuclease subunit A n=1 Tax=Lapidilactobacillus achengensis TaxID=2486000 RepID=A0ABW1UMT7_9LACO|nr:helicase-exonuclease AddAB subunit AddA [Lapidilactobacillus achengensis]
MPNFTQQQQDAIRHHGHDILVSASAGSGKTTVLVERLITEILEQGTDLDQLLVVTFTDAAAAEMQARIRKALEQELARAQAPEQQRLRKQINLLAAAQISTLHAFCSQVIHKFYYLLDLDPSFRLLTDDTERQLLMEQVWGELRDRYYDADDREFFDLADQFGSDRSDDGLTQVIFQLYYFAITRPETGQWLTGLTQNYQIDQTIDSSLFYQKWLAPYFRQRCQQLQQQFTVLAQTAKPIIKAEVVTEPAAASLALLTALLAQPHPTYADFKNTIAGLQLPARFMKALKKNGEVITAAETDTRLTVSRLLQTLREDLKKFSGDYFQRSETQIVADQKKAQQVVQTLAKITTEFISAYQTEKRRLKALDFNDLEQLTWQLLSYQDPQDQTRPVRDYYQQRFHEVMVDEYQDINPLQEAILQTVSQRDPGNLFMVGDVKQSIYGFRQADPRKFLDKYAAFKATSNPGERIILAENFRSAENINASTNFIFEQLMHHDLVELDYDEDAQLKTGATAYPASLGTTTELLLYEAKNSGAAAESAGISPEAYAAFDKKQATIAILGRRLQQMHASGYQICDGPDQPLRPMAYRDVAILVPTRANNLEIVNQLAEFGIPVYVQDANDYFQTTEIQVMLALLALINNPEQDIPLVTVLRSPIGDFDENDLAAIRGRQRTGNFYQALQALAALSVPAAEAIDPVAAEQATTSQTSEPGQLSDQLRTLAKKSQDFLAMLQDFRDYSAQHSIAELVWRIYQTTGYLNYVGGMPGGLQRSMNLHALYQRAFVYEQSSFKGLYQFIDFIAEMQSHQQDLAQAQVGDADQDAVQLMTIHGSKGLEFPIVCLYDLDHGFNNSDYTKNAVVLDGQLGLGLKYYDRQTRIKYPTLIDTFIRQQRQQGSIAEEMRKLYVALTRAKQKLLLVGAIDTWESTLAKFENPEAEQTPLLPVTLRDPSKLHNFLSMILPAVLRSPKLQISGGSDQTDSAAKIALNQADFLIHLYQAPELMQTIQPSMAAPKTAPTTLTHLDEKLAATITKLLDFQYPHQTATQTTAYQSVSEIKQAFADPDQFQLSFLPLATGQTAASLQPAAANAKMDEPVASRQPAPSGRYLDQEFPAPAFLTATQEVTGAQIGTATHLLLQRVDLRQTMTLAYLAGLRQELTTAGLIDAAVAARIDLTAVQNFFATDLGQLLQAPENQVFREVPFSLLLPAQAIFAMPDEPEIQNLLVHGIMDGYVITPDEVILFDYKTDHLGSGPNQAKRLAALIEKYRGQLNLYGQALSSILQRPVSQQYLYFLSANKLVALTGNNLTA